MQKKLIYSGLGLAAAIVAAVLLRSGFISDQPAETAVRNVPTADEIALGDQSRDAMTKSNPRPMEGNGSESGQKIYMSKGCYQCHGMEGQGALLTGPRIGPDPLPLPAFKTYVRHAPGEMPAYSPDVLSDEEIGGIHEFLQSRPQPSPQALEGVKP